MSHRFEPAIARAAARLAELGDPETAAGLAAYMKTDMPCLGVTRPRARLVLRQLRDDVDPQSRAEYEELVLDLWHLPHREEKHLAVDLAIALRRFVTIDSLDLYERLIREGGWWDFVDTIATKLINPVLRADPAAWERIDGWIDHSDLWLRRTAIICQLPSKSDTDTARLAAYCTARMHEKEFFIRKAIGWALREYAKTDPDWVRSFVDAHRDEMSGLSIREATKHL